MLVHNLNLKYKFMMWILPMLYIPKLELQSKQYLSDVTFQPTA
jgi:hypothetical protein